KSIIPVSLFDLKFLNELAATAEGTSNRRHWFLVRAQKGEELDALAQAAFHHLRALDHLADDRGDLRRAEIEPAIEVLPRVEDLAVAQIRVLQRLNLHAALVDQLGVLEVEPAVLHRLLVEERARIRRSEGHLDCVWVDLGGEADRLLDRLLGLA